MNKAETYYSEIIKVGNFAACNSLAWMYIRRRVKPVEALEFARTAYREIPQSHVAHTFACALLWSNQIQEGLDLLEQFVEEESFLSNNSDWGLYLFLLLAKSQYDFLYDYFTGPKGQELQLKDRFKPIWYALLYYLRDRYRTDYLRMPPEIKQTVEEVIARVEQMRVDYAGPV